MRSVSHASLCILPPTLPLLQTDLYPCFHAATFEGGLQEQAKLMNEMGKITDAAVIITNQICSMEEVLGYNRLMAPVQLATATLKWTFHITSVHCDYSSFILASL